MRPQDVVIRSEEFSKANSPHFHHLNNLQTRNTIGDVKRKLEIHFGINKTSSDIPPRN